MTSSRITLAAAMLLTLLMTSGDLVANDLIAEIRNEREQDRAATVDVTHVVSAWIPIGTNESAAKEILEKNGFKLYAHAHLPNGSYRLVASHIEKSRHPIVSEYRIVLAIENGRVASVFGRIFLQTL